MHFYNKTGSLYRSEPVLFFSKLAILHQLFFVKKTTWKIVS
ncbi:hypothetical protein BN424_2376 [Carnobacterium maltaromaticum LMA28]|uniref:Uncharacterized protein n=1 Tax=Carnobacterium maltaromaticum LMA28 TaxID=1234679 RepID=K8ETA2_CARML|nr:hypothetical protein BN424_2376 [Carnobacterium maltaromaticum LMA28]